MPIYEFTCRKCGRECEILVRSSLARPACPGCGGKQLERKMSMFAAQGTQTRTSSCGGCKSSKCSTCRR